MALATSYLATLERFGSKKRTAMKVILFFEPLPGLENFFGLREFRRNNRQSETEENPRIRGPRMAREKIEIFSL